METGVYTITCLANNKIYVGSTEIKFSKRKYKHFYELERNIHNNKHLQAAYNLYGAENIIFEILEETLPEYAISQEQYWVNMLQTNNKNFGYNKRAVVKSNAGIRYTEEQKKNFTGMTGRTHSEETKKKMSASAMGKTFSEVSKKKMSDSRKGRIITQEWRDNISKANVGKKGKSHTEETKNKIKATKLQKKLSGWVSPLKGRKLSKEDSNKLQKRTGSPEAKEKRALKRRGQKFNKETRKYYTP